MKRKIVPLIAIALLLGSAVGAFAYEQKSKVYSWMASFNRTGQLNLYAAVGFYYVGFDVDGGPEVILANFDVGGVPLQFGVMARGLIGFGSFAGASWTDWGVAPMATLHWGIDVGNPWKFEFYIGLGAGIWGTTGTYYTAFSGAGPFFGFASADGVAWHVSENISIIIDYAYTGWVSVYGVGVKLNI